MKRYEITWFKDFECLCGKCPNTCCKGWVIPLEERDIARFKKERGILGLRLFLETRGFLSDRFNAGSGTCTFCGADALCGMQKKKGHDFIPWTCQSYPRFYRNFGDFEECCLDLSCPEAARLMIANNGSCELLESEADAVTQPCATNDDREFFEYLLLQRKLMIGAIGDHFTKDPRGICGALFMFAVRLQDHYMTDSTVCDLSFDSFYPATSCCFPLSQKTLKAILSSSLNHRRLKSVSPALFRMFRAASNALESYDKKGSADTWEESVDKYLDKNPRVLSVLGSYLSYYLFQYFMRTYETYSFRRQIALGLCHLSMVLLLIMTGDESSSPTDEYIAKTISVYNRRAYFNDSILDEMYRIFGNC